MLDALTIAALTDELGRRLLDGRIQKVIQLDGASIALEVYADHQRRMLLASADARNPRLHLTASKLSADPELVSPLLLLLRKYARGGQVVAIQQPPLERVVRVSIAKRFWSNKNGPAEGDDDEDAEIVYTHLYVELMGRRSNIILTDDEGRILDAIKRVTPDMSRVRPILPGRRYTPPPPQEKLDPRHLRAEDIAAILSRAQRDEPLAGILVRELAGFSPLLAREAVFRATGDTASSQGTDTDPASLASRLGAAIMEILEPLRAGAWEPALYTVDGAPVAFSPIRLRHLGDADEVSCESVSAAIERGLQSAGSAQPVRHQQRRDLLVRQIHDAVERVEARLRSLEEQRARAEAAERWRQSGELIYAYLWAIEPGQTALDIEGVRIPLDPSRSPSENAQDYFERYRKAQSASEHLPELLERARTERDYLRQLETMASQADGFEEIEQVRREWESWAAPTEGAAKARPARSDGRRPRPYRTERGDLIYVGRNGRQNEQVTFEIAGPDDLWLHARGIPGSHVILHPADPDDREALERAASLAAWFSAGRDATSVEVDVTPRRYVRKIKGAGPGMVTYRNERTINARPRGPEELGLSHARTA